MFLLVAIANCSIVCMYICIQGITSVLAIVRLGVLAIERGEDLFRDRQGLALEKQFCH